ncbi:hypothetical protein PF003_g3714 [Phytophthora fragariae]|nr:hypothetical protein PF003_g3714 [Phytophthora fragariae]
MRQWLLSRTDALRHLFAFLPYPEQEAKTWPLDMLDAWGAQEVFLEQTAALKRIVMAPDTRTSTREFCTEWLQAAMDTQRQRRRLRGRRTDGEEWPTGCHKAFVEINLSI